MNRYDIMGHPPGDEIGGVDIWYHPVVFPHYVQLLQEVMESLDRQYQTEADAARIARNN